MKRPLFVLIVCIFANNMLAQSPKLTLEHTFDGHFYPYNMEVYNPISDDDRYFWPGSININGNYIESAIYNEDYSIRKQISAAIDTPEGYKIQTVTMSDNLILPDGTEFFIVTFENDDYNQRGMADYVISKAYSFAQGNPVLFDVASSTGGIYITTPLYVVNGKVSLIVQASEYESAGYYYKKTHVFSLGKVEFSSAMQVSSDVNPPYPIRTYDMTGRLINMEEPGTIPVIIQYSDGSAVKMVK